MREIQLILVLISLLLAGFASFVFRSRLWYRLIAILFFLMATAFVLFPDATNVIAHQLGVGRGADLLLYINVLATLHVFLLLYAKIRKLEQKLALEIRALAIRDAQLLSAGPAKEPVLTMAATRN